MRIKQEIARIVEESHPGCAQSKECDTKCGACAAERILPVFLRWLERHGSQVQTELFKEEMTDEGS